MILWFTFNLIRNLIFHFILFLMQGWWTSRPQTLWLAWRESRCTKGGSFWISGFDEIGEPSLHLRWWSKSPMWSCSEENVFIAWKVCILFFLQIYLSWIPLGQDFCFLWCSCWRDCKMILSCMYICCFQHLWCFNEIFIADKKKSLVDILLRA